MAEKRMFAKSIVLSDVFLDMPMSARCLYFTLSMFADDDGFVGSPKGIMRQCGASQDDLSILIAKRYVLIFESGVIVIKHWRINNYLRNDRHIPTTYLEEKATLSLDGKGAYIEKNNDNCGWYTNGIPSIEENSIDKCSVEESSIDLDLSNNKTISKDNTSCSSNDIQKIVEAWNHLNLKRVSKIIPGTQRDDWLRKRIKDYGVDEILRAINNVKASPFLLGKNKSGWTITFDWFIRPNNFPKVLDGNYTEDTPNTVSRGKKPITNFEDAR